MILDFVADPGFLRQRAPAPLNGRGYLLFGQLFPENCMKMKKGSVMDVSDNYPKSATAVKVTLDLLLEI